MHVETDPGAVIMLPAWMLDPVVCNQMSLGDPHVDLQALREFSDLLEVLGLRSSLRSGITAAKEDTDEDKDLPENSAIDIGLGPSNPRRPCKEGASPGPSPCRLI